MSNDIETNPIEQIYSAIRETGEFLLTRDEMDRVFSIAYWGLNSAQSTVLPEKPIFPFHHISLTKLLNTDGELISDQEIFEVFRNFFLNVFIDFAKRELERRERMLN